MNKLAHAFFAASVCALLGFSLLALSGCATKHQKPLEAVMARPETVLITYHVKAGMELVFEDLLSRAWQTYRKEDMVLSEPHIIVREVEEGNKIGYVEIFTWATHAAPGRASAAVKEIWAQETGLCEARSGRPGLGGGEVELIVPAHK